MANEIGSALGQIHPQQEIRNDARQTLRAKQGESGLRRNQQITDQVLVSNRATVQQAHERNVNADSDPRVQSLSGAVDTSILLEGFLDEAGEIVEDLRAALSASEKGAATELEQEFYQTLGNFTNVLQDGGRLGNNLLTSDISRLQVEVPNQEAPYVIEGVNILAAAEEGGVFDTRVFSNRGELDVEQLAQAIGTSNPVELAELPDNVLASLQSLLTVAQNNLGELRETLGQNLNDLQQLLRTAQVIQETGENPTVINEERANLVALQTRQQLENIGGGSLENSQEEILQFFR